MLSLRVLHVVLLFHVFVLFLHVFKLIERHKQFIVLNVPVYCDLPVFTSFNFDN